MKKIYILGWCVLICFILTGNVLCESKSNLDNANKNIKEGQDNKGSDNGNDKNSKDNKEGQDNKGTDNGNDKDSKDGKDGKDSKDGKDGKDGKDSKDGKDEKKDDPKDEKKKPEDKIIIKKIKIGGSNTTNTINNNEKKKTYTKDNKYKKEDEETEYETVYDESDLTGYPGTYSGGSNSFSHSGFISLDLKYALLFTARYSLLSTYFSSTLESSYFTGEWKGDMLFTGRGGEASFAIMGLDRITWEQYFLWAITNIRQ